ncbi:MAG TPA: CHRD domain-containing protein [Methylomirabilota bacterium]|nr:CHRD domain-containing protein [Methylomirabilota bacterium]
MKTTIISLLLLGAVSMAAAQGILEFSVTLDGNHAVPPNATSLGGEGTFSLSPAFLFQGDVFIVNPLRGGNLTIYSSTAVDALGTAVFTLEPLPIIPPDPTGEAFRANRTLTATERGDLLAGNWWAVYTTPSLPGEMIRGQIVLVPEPSTWALLAAGGVVVGWYGRRKMG